MLKIDSHTHILPRVMPKWSERFGYGGFIHLEVSRPGYANMMRDDQFFREIASNCWDAEERIEEYGRAGVQVQVVSTIPVMFSYWAKPEHAADLSRFLNEHIAELVQTHPRHYVGLATVPMQDTDVAIAVLEDAAKQGHRGVANRLQHQQAQLGGSEISSVLPGLRTVEHGFVHPPLGHDGNPTWNAIGFRGWWACLRKQAVLHAP